MDTKDKFHKLIELASQPLPSKRKSGDVPIIIAIHKLVHVKLEILR